MTTEEAALLNGMADWIRQLNDDEAETAARNLKPFFCGEELYYRRFGRTSETERIYDDAVPREFKPSSYFQFLTPEAAAKWVDSFRRELVFNRLCEKYDPERQALFERMTGRDDVERALRKIDPNCD